MDEMFVLCFEGDVAIDIHRDRGVAESSMEAPDIEEWTVYDTDGYRYALSPKKNGAVAIGERVGDPVMNDLLARLRGYLEWARPERSWAEVPLEALLEAAEEANE
jgi:hypothetical protein